MWLTARARSIRVTPQAVTMGIGPVETRRATVGRLALLLTSSRLLGTTAADAAPKLTLPPLAEGRRRLYLVRHGETDWNADGRIQGRTDKPLNDAGLAQAAALARFLADQPIALVASSTLGRASKTADAVAEFHPSARRVRDTNFIEMSFGDYEGQKLADFQPAYKTMIADWADGATGKGWPNGESVDDVAARGLAGLRSLGILGTGTAAAESCPRHVLVAAHGRFNKILISALQGDVARCSEIDQGNTCVNVLDLAPDGSCSVVVLNVRDHLLGADGQVQLGKEPPVPGVASKLTTMSASKD
tara:strand:- start:616 stop:1524 length:909 start_codon:yes stop_codon:yes gene_type:complete